MICQNCSKGLESWIETQSRCHSCLSVSLIHFLLTPSQSSWLIYCQREPKPFCFWHLLVSMCVFLLLLISHTSECKFWVCQGIAQRHHVHCFFEEQNQRHFDDGEGEESRTLLPIWPVPGADVLCVHFCAMTVFVRYLIWSVSALR